MTSYYDEPVTVRRGDLEALLESSRRREYIPFSLSEVHRHVDRALATKPDSDPGRTAVEHVARVGCTFDDFWAAWPVKAGKKAGKVAWAKAVKRADPCDIIAGAAAYAQFLQVSDQKPKYPQGWLNDDRWEDDYEAMAAMSNDRSKTDVNRTAIVKGAMNLDHRTPAERLAAAQQKELGS